jgi:hypothetical protein
MDIGKKVHRSVKGPVDRPKTSAVYFMAYGDLLFKLPAKVER